MFKNNSLKWGVWAAILLSFVLFAGACGGGDGDDAGTTTPEAVGTPVLNSTTTVTLTPEAVEAPTPNVTIPTVRTPETITPTAQSTPSSPFTPDPGATAHPNAPVTPIAVHPPDGQ